MPRARQPKPAGRPAQRRRTRAALLAAAIQIVQTRGAVPSVAEVAAVADVSRRTAYRYFPTAEQLVTEAILETMAPQLDPKVIQANRGDDPAVRVTTLVRRMQELAVANEPLLRTMIRLTIDQAPPPAGGRRPAARGSRRVAWLGDALELSRKRLDAAAYERLLSALCLCVGAEAFIVLRDIRGLSVQQAIDVCVWAAGALVQAALRNTPKSDGRLNRGRRSRRQA